MKKNWNNPELKNLSVCKTNEPANGRCPNYSGPEIQEIPQYEVGSLWDWWQENICPKCCFNGTFHWCPGYKQTVS